MKKTLFILLTYQRLRVGVIVGFFSLITSFAQAQKVVVSQTDDAITFIVDKDLPAPEGHLRMEEDEDLVAILLNKFNVPDENRQVLDYSFKGEQTVYMGTDVLCRCMLKAYAEHRPLVLKSAAMVWPMPFLV